MATVPPVRDPQRSVRVTRLAGALHLLVGALVLVLAVPVAASGLSKPPSRKNTARQEWESWAPLPSLRGAATNHLVGAHGSDEPAVGKPLEREDLTRSGDDVPAADYGARTRHKRQDQPVLPAPTNLRVMSSARDSVSLQWQYDRGDVEFLVNVYYSDGSFALDRVARGTSATVQGLAPSTTYQFSVKAFKALPHGRRANSADSERVTARTQELVLPTPASLRATSGRKDAINLAWQYERGDVEFLVNVYYSDGSFIKDQVVRGTSATVQGLAPSTSYQFSVKAFKALPHGQRANSADSERVTARTQGTPPVQPPRPPSTTQEPRPPTTHATPPPPPPSSSPAPPSPTVPPVDVRCQGEGQCTCPPPHQHVCVPCGRIDSCSKIDEDAVCSTKPAAGSVGMTVNVLSCGFQPILNVEGILRNTGGVQCGSGGSVPAQTVALVECWGSATFVVECHSDGTWRPYGDHQSNAPSVRQLCQYETVNSPLCGRRPPFLDVGGLTVFPSLPHWPWLAGLFLLESYICTATIISRQFLLTAAHCVTRTQETSKETVDIRDLRAQYLSSTGQVVRRFVSSVHVSPEFRAGIRPSHDVSLVRLQEPITYSYHVYPACINTQGFPRHTVAATFNRTSALYKWQLLPQTLDPRCHAPHDDCAASINLDKDQFCATDITSSMDPLPTESESVLAEGSSGGPYLVNEGSDAVERWVVAGLISSSYTRTSCAGTVTICTYLADFWPWISRCVQEGNCS